MPEGLRVVSLSVEHVVSYFRSNQGQIVRTLEDVLMMTHLRLFGDTTNMKLEMNEDEKENHDFLISLTTITKVFGKFRDIVRKIL